MQNKEIAQLSFQISQKSFRRKSVSGLFQKTHFEKPQIQSFEIYLFLAKYWYLFYEYMLKTYIFVDSRYY